MATKKHYAIYDLTSQKYVRTDTSIDDVAFNSIGIGGESGPILTATSDGHFDLNGKKLTNAATPVNAGDFATKSYVDSRSSVGPSHVYTRQLTTNLSASAVSFTAKSTEDFTWYGLPIYKVGNPPVYGVTISLHEDNNGKPGTVIGFDSTAMSAISSTPPSLADPDTWLWSTNAFAWPMVEGTKYWLSVRYDHDGMTEVSPHNWVLGLSGSGIEGVTTEDGGASWWSDQLIVFFNGGGANLEHIAWGYSGLVQFNNGPIPIELIPVDQLPQPTWIVKNSAYTIVSGDKILADTHNGPFSLTLPTGTEGAWCEIMDAYGTWATNNCTVTGGKIEGVDEDLLLNVNNGRFTLAYVDATHGWAVGL